MHQKRSVDGTDLSRSQGITVVAGPDHAPVIARPGGRDSVVEPAGGTR